MGIFTGRDAYGTLDHPYAPELYRSRKRFPLQNGRKCRIEGVVGLQSITRPATLAGLSVCGVRPR